MESTQTAAIDRVRERVQSAAFYPPRERQSLSSWASNRGHGALGAVFSAVFDAGGRDRFEWALFGAKPYFQEPTGDLGGCAVILVSEDTPEGAPLVAPLRPAVVVDLDLDGLTGRDGLIALVERVADGLEALIRGRPSLRNEDHAQ